MKIVVDSQEVANKISNSAYSIVTSSYNVLSNGLLALGAILLMSMALMSVALPFVTLIILSAGQGDEVLKNSQFWLILGLSFVPTVIVLGFLSKE